jgi:hypothetical protein
MFEPRLEPGLSQGILDELEAQDIRLIHVFTNFGDPNITTYGFDAKPFYAGDIDDDDDVDGPDFALFAANWGDTGCGLCAGADLTGDGNVDFYDLKEFADNWLAGK